MKALSIKQPWAWLICSGYKDIENRNWSLFRYIEKCPIRVHIHAGKKVDDEGAIWLWENRERLGILGCSNRWIDICNTWNQGALIGEVDITGQIFGGDNPWFVGKYGYCLENPMLYDKPISCRGKLGFFEVTLPD